MNVNNGNLSLSFSLFFAETLSVGYGHWFYCKGRHYSAFQTKRGKLMCFAVKDNWWLSLRIFVAIWLVGKNNFHRNNMPTKIQNPEAEHHLFVRPILPVYSRVHIIYIYYILWYITIAELSRHAPHMQLAIDFILQTCVGLKRKEIDQYKLRCKSQKSCYIWICIFVYFF